MHVEWSESLATGVPEVDEQHKELIRQLNLLNDAMSEGKGKEKIGGMLQFFLDYSKRHFKKEEECMQQYRCPAAEINKAAHAQFLVSFSGLQSRFQAEGASEGLVLELRQRVSEWLVRHIQGVDSQLGKAVQEAGKAARG